MLPHMNAAAVYPGGTPTARRLGTRRGRAHADVPFGRGTKPSLQLSFVKLLRAYIRSGRDIHAREEGDRLLFIYLFFTKIPKKNLDE